MELDFDPIWNRPAEDPYTAYQELRDHAPVHRAPKSGLYVLSRYDDVEYVLKTAEVFPSGGRMQRQGQLPLRRRGPLARLRLAASVLLRMRVPPRSFFGSRFLISEDGAAHAAMRAIVSRGFTPRRISAWEGRARELASEGVKRLQSGEPFDLVHDLAVPLPVTMIAEMLGVGSDRMRDFKRWSDAFITAGTGSGALTGDGSAMFDAMAELRRYLRPIVRARRSEPREDLISVLVSEDSDLDDFEVFMFIFLLLLAGNETTTNLLGNAVDALLLHPAELEKVQRDPSLVPKLVEEVLRWDSPVQMLQRGVASDVELHGVRIPQGARVAVMLGSANRDERRFPDPDRFDVERMPGAAHMSFGFGPHFCLGAALARLEARAALEALVPALTGIVRVTPEREFVDSFVVRGLTRLELRAA